MPKADKKTVDKWNAKNRYGDNRKIQEQSDISEHAIGRCIRTGRGSKETIEAINKFYKIEQTKRVLTDIDNVN